MKKFIDLKVGDTIYYYDHCKMKPQKVHFIEECEEERSYNGYFGQIHTVKVRYLKMLVGKNKKEYILEDIESHCSDFILDWKHMFSCKEAAEEFLQERRQVAKDQIKEAKRIIAKYNTLIPKYDLC